MTEKIARIDVPSAPFEKMASMNPGSTAPAPTTDCNISDYILVFVKKNKKNELFLSKAIVAISTVQ
ncbi:hypothetical protein [Roseibium sp.]|uniref:hypothetical protein n=1 Tax=Roseibium sp. TaxID=1936156 RepID=UPI003BAF5924